MAETIDGYVAPGFERVADAFRLNFSDRGDRGAACSVVIENNVVVDLWGGEARLGKRWTRTTRGAVFSVSKAVTALSVLMAAQRGLLDIDEPVATYWPEFEAHGKGKITVRSALAHRAGVPSFTHPWDAGAVAAWNPIVDDLASQVPMWEPGSAFTYHPISVGFIAGEVLRRATGKRPSQWLAEYIAAPLDVEITYGADPIDADLAYVQEPGPGFNAGRPVTPEVQALITRSVLGDAAYGPDLFTAVNTAAFLGSESPAANVVTRARDLAKLFAAVVYPVNGARLLNDSTIAHATEPVSFGKPFLGADAGHVWGAGFMIHSARRGMAGPGSFGHDGAGGQLAFAQPRFGLGFGYQTNVPTGDDQDIRAEALCAALRECL